ncbi:sugar phosphate isomerase/epimerase family protein [Glaciibacter superstes]|uniref:sugar phosphate isomerase/epimerase family protein n=1 Tax=Glaciibacter superstes TaxID=501023 RepID=UPI0003B3B898|nr:sugar phosphate isomerase/epimerase [Glaciibacter superstes]
MRAAISKPTARDETPALFAGFRTAGFEGLQLKTGQFMPWIDSPERLLEATGGDPGAVATLVYYDELDDGRLSSVIGFAGKVGSEMVVFCHNRSREGVTSEERIRLAEQLAEHGRRAAQLGIRLSLHHHYGQPVMLPEDVREFWGAIEPGVIGLTVDTGHLVRSGVEDIPGFLREFAPIIDNIHLKDVQGDDWCLPGEGELDLDLILDTMAEIGYGGWLCIDEESTAPLDESLRVAGRWLAERSKRVRQE